MTEVRLGDKRIPFIYQGNELIHPNPVKDGLVLWYDFSGRTNDDAKRDVAEDLSGNGNHGTLRNFNFTAESGYDKNHLLFDGIDDYLQIPDLNLSENATTVQVGDNIYVYDGDKVVTVGKDSIEVGGRNYLENSKERYIKPRNGGYLSDNFNYETYHLTKELTGQVTVSGFIEFEEGTSNSLTILLRNSDDNTISMLILDIGEDGYFEGKADVSQIIHRIYIYMGRSGQTRGNGGYLRLVKIEKGNKATDWTPTPEDLINKTNITHSPLRSLKYYNRPLTREEIAHNYQIEKERFGIIEEEIEPTNLPIGKASIGSTLKVGGDNK